jgi:hypothetical protein
LYLYIYIYIYQCISVFSSAHNQRKPAIVCVFLYIYGASTTNVKLYICIYLSIYISILLYLPTYSYVHALAYIYTDVHLTHVMGLQMCHADMASSFIPYYEYNCNNNNNILVVEFNDNLTHTIPMVEASTAW